MLKYILAITFGLLGSLSSNYFKAIIYLFGVPWPFGYTIESLFIFGVFVGFLLGIFIQYWAPKHKSIKRNLN